MPHTSSTDRDGITTARGGGRGGEGGGRLSWMAPECPSCGGGEDQGMQLSGSGGALASLIFAKRQQQRDQRPYDANIWRITRGGQGRDTETRRDLQRATPPPPPPGPHGPGGVRQHMNGGRCRHAERGAGTSGGGWRVAGASDTQVGGALHREKR